MDRPNDLELRSVLRAHLFTLSTVTAIAESRIYTTHSKRSAEVTARQPAVVFEQAGGVNLQSAPAGVRTVRVYSYSSMSLDQALQLHQAVTEALERQGIKHPKAGTAGAPTACLYLAMQNGPTDGWNPDVGAWFVRADWRVFTKQG